MVYSWISWADNESRADGEAWDVEFGMIMVSGNRANIDVFGMKSGENGILFIRAALCVRCRVYVPK